MAIRFDLMSEAYDAMIDWDKRLARETPFCQWVFKEANAQSVLDAACGTGRHVALFASWGLEVEGADLSPEMIEWCRKHHKSLRNARWEERSFTEPAGKLFDAVLCTGNSLALLEDLSQVAAAVAAMGKAVRPGGALVLHAVQIKRTAGENFVSNPVVWDKCRKLKLSAGECFLFKGTHACGNSGYVDFILAPLKGKETDVITRSIRFLSLKENLLRRHLRKAGFRRIEAFGSYDRTPFEPGVSTDLIVAAFKQ